MTPSDIQEYCEVGNVLRLHMTRREMTSQDDRVALYVHHIGSFDDDVYLGTDADLHIARSSHVGRMFRDEQEARSMASLLAKRMRRHAIRVEVVDAAK